MSIPPPKIDPRRYDDIVRQTIALAQKLAPDWQPRETADAGQALIRIFGRMAMLVSDRLNRTPEKNFLAFLDLIGTQIRPPQPARVPLTFELVEGSPVDAFVPAQTQVAALLPDGKEVVFETEQELVVTTAQLKAAFVREPSRDRFRDCTPQVTGLTDAAFSMFEGDRPIEHSLYFACDELLTLPGHKTVTVSLRSPEAADLSWFPITWSVWDGAAWKPVLGVIEGLNVTISSNQEVTISKGRAIDAQGNQIVLAADRTLRIDRADKNQAVVISADSLKSIGVAAEALNTAAGTAIQLARLTIDADGNIQPSFQTTARSIATWEFTLSENLPTSVKQTLNGTEAAWLRASLHRPLPADQVDLPQLLSLDLKVNMTRSDLLPELCSFNTAAIDLSKDFFPFGEQPRFNDTFYIASQDVFARAGAIVTLSIEISNPPPLPIHPLHDVELEWEIWTGQTWQTLRSTGFEDNTRGLTVTGTIQFKLPARIALASVGGEVKYWVRARIIRGSYRTEATQAATITSLREAATKDSKTLLVNDIRGFVPDDRIQIGAEAELAVIDSVNLASTSRQITLKQALQKLYPQGTSVMLLAGFGAPSIKSIELGYTYESDRVPASDCIAQNDLNWVALSVPKLCEKVSSGAQVLKLTTVAMLAVRDEKYRDHPFSPTWQQIWLQNNRAIKTDKILSVDFQASTVTLTQPLTDPYELDTTIVAFCALLAAQVNEGSNLLKVSYVEGFTVGTSLRLMDANQRAAEVVEIEAIDRDRNLLILKQAVKGSYAAGSTLTPIFRPFIPTSDRHPAFYLGFDQPFANRLMSLYFQVEPLAPSDRAAAVELPAKLTAEYASLSGWTHLGAQDQTQGLTESGLTQFIAPPLQLRSLFGQTCYWLRVRWEAGSFRVLPRLRRVLTNTMWASQTTTLTQEILGSSSGEPHQTYFTTQAPVLPGLCLEIQEGTLPPPEEQAELDAIAKGQAVTIEQDQGQIMAVWVRWQNVPDFYGSSGRDRHYTIDYLTGRIQFGDGQSGRVPPQGRNNIRLSRYQTGGGKHGEFPPGTVNQLKTTVPYVNQVTNLEAGGGGAAQESLESVQERGPKQLRHRGRAVTVQDFEDLAFEASPDVARAKAIAPQFDPLEDTLWLDPSQGLSIASDLHKTAADQVGTVRLLIVPFSTARQPTPSLALIDRVSDYIRSRCAATVDLQVMRPQWEEVVITTTIVPVSLQGADLVQSQVLQRLESFLHPLTGGAKGEGWTFGRRPQASDLYAAIAAVPGVDHVESLEIRLNQDSLPADTLVFSGSHVVQLLQSGGRS